MFRRALLVLAAVALLAPALALAVRPNPADRLADLPIDDYAYDHAERCAQRPAKGALALQRWLEANVRGAFWGIMRCEKLSGRHYSLHAEGRAIDWHLDAHRPADRRAANRLIKLLLATDRAGNPHALARRMGIQEIIWDCRSWWSGARGMGPYSLCERGRGGKPKRISDTLAHRDHIHFGLSRPGARARTSFWARRQ